jgi:hypothetical protein
MYKIGMDIEFENIFRTTPKYFFKWIKAETSDVVGRPGCHFCIREPGKTTYIGLTRLKFHGNVCDIEAMATIERDGSDEGFARSLGVVIRFEAIQVSDKETQIIGGCKNIPEIKVYFGGLWTQILNIFSHRSLEGTTEKDSDSMTIYKKDHQNKKPSGRPHFPEDIWAWEQVNLNNRESTQVRKEWKDRAEVKKRNLVDPDRQFKRIIKPDWYKGTKP